MSHPRRTVGRVRRLIIFDGDDTLWRVEHLYDEARDRAASIVRDAGIDPLRWSDLQRELDVANVATLGLSRLRFPHSSVGAYERAAAEAGVAVHDDITEQVRLAAASVFERKAPLMAGARAVLDELRRTHRLVLLTQGDPVVQNKRVDDSGLRARFELVHIVERKDDSSFAAVLAETDVAAGDAWSVGNSIPSDINPALRLGLSAVWIEAHVWAHEQREDTPADGRFFVCESLKEVPNIIEQHSLLVG